MDSPYGKTIFELSFRRSMEPFSECAIVLETLETVSTIHQEQCIQESRCYRRFALPLLSEHLGISYSQQCTCCFSRMRCTVLLPRKLVIALGKPPNLDNDLDHVIASPIQEVASKTNVSDTHIHIQKRPAQSYLTD